MVVNCIINQIIVSIVANFSGFFIIVNEVDAKNYIFEHATSLYPKYA